jgi:SAM-dependent methyltransferase
MSMLTEAEKLDLDVLGDAVGYQQWVIDSFGPELNGNVLEIGAGTGNFTRQLATRVEQLTALEPDVSLFRSLAALQLRGVKVVHGSIESYRPGDRFDSVLMINVLEHIGDDIDALRTVRSWLAQRGWIFVFVPAHPALFGSLDDKYRHVRRYSERELRRALSSAGFRTGWVRHMNALGALGWFVVGRILRVQSISIRTVALNERFIVPVGRRIERVIRPPFGQSLIAGARRTDLA